MVKVLVTIHNKQALVDSDQVSKILRKEALVKQALVYSGQYAEGNRSASLIQSMREVSDKIVRINRTIRKNVKFL